jgi:hypothetical protein
MDFCASSLPLKCEKGVLELPLWSVTTTIMHLFLLTFLFFETGSHCAAQTDFKLAIGTHADFELLILMPHHHPVHLFLYSL